jgi:hypothetical protein
MVGVHRVVVTCERVMHVQVQMINLLTQATIHAARNACRSYPLRLAAMQLAPCCTCQLSIVAGWLQSQHRS